MKGLLKDLTSHRLSPHLPSSVRRPPGQTPQEQRQGHAEKLSLWLQNKSKPRFRPEWTQLPSGSGPPRAPGSQGRREQVASEGRCPEARRAWFSC